MTVEYYFNDAILFRQPVNAFQNRKPRGKPTWFYYRLKMAFKNLIITY